jgi:hypothetical protein
MNTLNRTPIPLNSRAIFDSGTTGHYIMLTTECTNRQIATHPITVTLPNGGKIQSSHTATLPFTHLPSKAIEAHLFPELNGQALLSIGTFCDAGCTALFEATGVKILFKGNTVLEGQRIPPGLWTTKLPSISEKKPTTLQANALHTEQSKNTPSSTYMQHVFSPVTDTWTAAIDQGYFKTWPMFTAADIRKHLPKSMATAMGHLDQQRKNTRSTKPKEKAVNPPTIQRGTLINGDITNPTAEPSNLTAFASVINITEPEEKSYSDLTGRFPARSQTGNLYVLVLYSFDDNAILVEPLKNRSDNEQLQAYHRIIERANQGSKLRIHWMDNEASKAVKTLLTKQFNLEYQLVPPHIHRRNAAERAIRTFKNHFIAGLCSAAEDFPMRLWDRLLHQAEITLNLMRTSRVNPAISAQEAINVPFDFNKTPMAPPGCKSDNPRKTESTHNLGAAWRCGLVLGTGKGTLPLLPLLCKNNKGRTHFRHSGIFPRHSHHTHPHHNRDGYHCGRIAHGGNQHENRTRRRNPTKGRGGPAATHRNIRNTSDRFISKGGQRPGTRP